MWCRVVGVLVMLTLSRLTAPLAAEAQPVGRAPARIGFISNADPQLAAPFIEAFRQGLRDLGWIEGQNLNIEYRWAEGKADRHPELAADLVRLQVDVIIASGSTALRAVKQATSRIPIVSAVLLADPVRLGLAASLAHPGGNLTGLASQYEEIVTKHVELLADVIPTLSRIVLLRHATTDTTVTRAAATAVDKLGLTVQILEVSEVGDFEGAFRTARDNGAQALLVLPSPFLNAHRRALIELAASYRLPAVYEFKEYVQDGGLMSYGPSILDMYRRAASYVDRILKGAKPGDLPIERPSKFELAINLKTATALGLTIPPTLLFQADEVIR
jgi:putative tryptophan/tyrosine transport system substrate-binding protein